MAIGALGVGRVDQVHDTVGDGLLRHEGNGTDAGGAAHCAAEGALDPLKGLAGLGNEGLHEVLIAVAVGHGEPALLHELNGVVLGGGVRAVIEGELVVAHSLEGALGELQRAAGEARLLKDDDGSAQLESTVCSVQTSTASTADDDVGSVGPLGLSGSVVRPSEGTLVTTSSEQAGSAGGTQETTARDSSVHSRNLLNQRAPFSNSDLMFARFCAIPMTQKHLGACACPSHV